MRKKLFETGLVNLVEIFKNSFQVVELQNLFHSQVTNKEKEFVISDENMAGFVWHWFE